VNLYPPMLLSTGRVVLHSPQANGSQLATPTPGPYDMTEQEWLEYCDRVRKSLSPPNLKTCAALRCQDMEGRTA